VLALPAPESIAQAPNLRVLQDTMLADQLIRRNAKNNTPDLLA
jgi:hypothetical protein